MSELNNLVLFYWLLGSVLVIILGSMKLYILQKSLKDLNLWSKYYEEKLVFNYGILAGIKRYNL